MAIEDWIDTEPPDDYAEQREVRCKYCRARDLYWGESRVALNEKGWVMVDDVGNVHRCKNFLGGSASAKDFPPA